MNNDQLKFEAAMRAVSNEIISNNQVMKVVTEFVGAAMLAGNEESENLSATTSFEKSYELLVSESFPDLLTKAVADAVRSGFLIGINLTTLGNHRKAKRIIKKYFAIGESEIESFIANKQELKELGL